LKGLLAGPDAEAPLTRDVTICFHQSAREIPADLWQRCVPPPAEGLWWYETLEQSSLEDQFRFSYAVVWRDKQPLAIAPLFTMDVPIEIVAPPAVAWALRQVGRVWPRLLYQRTLFVGSPCAEEGTVGIVEGVDLAAVAPPLQRALVERAKEMGAAMIVWKDFPQKTWPALRALCASDGLFEIVSFPNTVLEGIEEGFEAYLRRLSGRRRHRLRKKLRRSRSTTHLRAEVVVQPDEALLDEIWSLFQNTYNRAKVKFERLTKEFWQIITRQDVSHLILLRDAATGKPVAFMLAFLFPGWAINKFIGIDYSHGKESHLFFRLWEEFFHWAQKSGATVVQSGQTGYDAKLGLGHELVPLSNFAKHRNPIIHRVFALVAKSVSWSTLDADLRAFRSAHPPALADKGQK
jgi:uncharacterized protein